MKIILMLISLSIISASCSKKHESKQYIDPAKKYTNAMSIDVKSRDFDAIGLIKQSSFSSYSNIKIEDLISVFGSIEWQDFIAEDDYMRYIDAIGAIETNRYILQFKILSQYRWELYAFEINDKAYTIDEAAGRLYSLYTNRKK